jgi:hypothetical protein
MSFVKPTRENADKFRQYKEAENNFKKTINSKSIQEQRELVEQFSIKWWSSN